MSLIFQVERWFRGNCSSKTPSCFLEILYNYTPLYSNLCKIVLPYIRRTSCENCIQVLHAGINSVLYIMKTGFHGFFEFTPWYTVRRVFLNYLKSRGLTRPAITIFFLICYQKAPWIAIYIRCLKQCQSLYTYRGRICNDYVNFQNDEITGWIRMKLFYVNFGWNSQVQ